MFPLVDLSASPSLSKTRKIRRSSILQKSWFCALSSIKKSVLRPRIERSVLAAPLPKEGSCDAKEEEETLRRVYELRFLGKREGAKKILENALGQVHLRQIKSLWLALFECYLQGQNDKAYLALAFEFSATFEAMPPKK